MPVFQVFIQGDFNKLCAYTGRDPVVRAKDFFLDPDILPFMTVDVKVGVDDNSPADGVCIASHTATLLSLFVQIALEFSNQWLGCSSVLFCVDVKHAPDGPVCGRANVYAVFSEERHGLGYSTKGIVDFIRVGEHAFPKCISCDT